MTLLLNVLPWLLLAAGLALAWRRRRLWIALATAILGLAYVMAQPSYLPKGKVERGAPPPFPASDARIEDRNSKPVPGEVRDQRMRDAVRNGLDFKPSRAPPGLAPGRFQRRARRTRRSAAARHAVA